MRLPAMAWNILVLSALLQTPNTVFCQIEYPIEHFSSRYSAKIIIPDDQKDEIFKKATITVVDHQHKKEIIRVDSDELTFDIDNNNTVEANMIERPYGRQSVLIYQDFNFDGIEDIAVMDGQNSCYHGPSFIVYLYKEGEMRMSPEFTDLAQSYCGMFDIDYRSKTLSTMTKSGCCWHEFSTFKVVNNSPAAIRVLEEDAWNYPFITNKLTVWGNGKSKTSQTTEIDLTDGKISQLFSFKLKQNGKRVILFAYEETELKYALTTHDNLVEFSYPDRIDSDENTFRVSASKMELTFSNKGAKYTIYQKMANDKITHIGILVRVNGKTYTLDGNTASIKGDLRKITNRKLENVLYE